jgi:hypothetical protein
MMNAPSVLLVEGRDDEHVLYALAVAHQLPQTFKVKSHDGVEALLDSLSVRFKARNERRLGVLLDADEDIARRWTQLRARVEEHFSGVLPTIPPPQGTLVDLAPDFTFGAWVMPDNVLPGMLESFLAFLVPQHDVLLPRIDALLDSLGDAQRFPNVRRPKARLHGWLSLQSEPGNPLGQAVTARYLDPNAPHAQHFVTWLRAMFP